MTKEAVLITGANGEIGHGLIDYLQQSCDYEILALDIQPLDEMLSGACHQFIQGDILDVNLLDDISNRFSIRTIFHLASLLSTGAEKRPELAHNVNVNGTFNLLKMADKLGEKSGHPTKFIYPSSIAAYGLPGPEGKVVAGKVREDSISPTASPCTVSTNCIARTWVAILWVIMDRSAPKAPARMSIFVPCGSQD